jgi:putative endonuclease
MWYVYVIKSTYSEFTYIGSTNDLHRRFKEHNEGLGQSTKHFLPFELSMYVALPTEKQARQLEKYFKTGSGTAILKKRFLATNL